MDTAGAVTGVTIRLFGQDAAIGASCSGILATGGFQMNHAMMAAYAPRLLVHAKPIGGPHSDGSGIALGQSLGAAVHAMDAIHATASFYPPAQLISGIIVNALDQRFVAEDRYHGRTAAHICEQPGGKAWLILDSGNIAYPKLGKFADWLRPLDQPPFAAFDLFLKETLYHYHTLGGLKVDADARVRHCDDHTIQGLYAVGSCAATIVLSAEGYGSGMTLSLGSLFARIAGSNAASANRHRR